LTLAAGHYYTIALVGNPPATAADAVVFQDDETVTTSQAKVRVYHLSSTSGPISASDTSTVIAASLSFGQASNYATENPGTVSFTLKELNAPHTTANTAIALEASKVYSIFWMCGTEIVDASASGVPNGLPQTGTLNPLPDNTWWFVGAALLLLVGGLATARMLMVRRARSA